MAPIKAEFVMCESRNLDNEWEEIAEHSQFLVYALFWPIDHTTTSALIITFAFTISRWPYLLVAMH